MRSAYIPKIILLVRAKEHEAVEKLIQEGCNVNVQDDLERRAVHAAAAGNDLRMLLILINAGARVDVTDDFGQTPLSMAKKNKPYSNEMIEVIEKTIARYSSPTPPRP